MRLTRTAQRQVRKMDTRYVQKLIDGLKKYEQDSFGDVKNLTNREGYRLRVGGYRAIFIIENGEVVVQEIGVRGDVY